MMTISAATTSSQSHGRHDPGAASTRRTTAILLLVLTLIASACGGTETSIDSAPIGSETSDTNGTNDTAAAATVEPFVADPTATPMPDPTATPDPTTTPVPPTEIAPTEIPPTEVPPTAAPEPTAISETEPTARAATGLGTAIDDVDFSVAQILCVTDRLSADVDFDAETLDGASFDDLDVDRQLDVTVAALDCAPDEMSEILTASMNTGDDLPPEVSQCLVSELLDGEANRLALAGFVALGEDQPAPLETQEPVIQVMLTCMPGEVLIDAFAEEALADPTMAEALDEECLGGAMDEDVLRPLWTQMVQDPNADADAASEPLIAAILSCLAFGEVLAAEARADGVDLSAGSISCLNDAFREIDFMSIMGGTATPEAEQDMQFAILGCLNEEELLAMIG